MLPECSMSASVEPRKKLYFLEHFPKNIVVNWLHKEKPIEIKYEVYERGQLRFTGNYFKCFKYILNHQPQSVNYALKYEWQIKEKIKNAK